MTDLTSPPTTGHAPTGPPAPRPRGRAAGFVLLALGVIVASVLTVWYFTRSDGSETPTETEAIFDFAEDTLCDWFTAAQMDGVVAEAMARADLDVDVDSFSNGGSCWITSHVNEGAIWGTAAWQNPGPGDGVLGITLAPVANDPRGEQDRLTDPADFEHHFVLDDAIVYGNVTQLGFAYSPGTMVQLQVEGHEDELLFLGVGVEGSALDQTATPQQLAFALSLADIMLEQMNWTD